LRFENFLKDETLKRAFVRGLGIISEAVKNIPEEMTGGSDSVFNFNGYINIFILIRNLL